MRSVPARNICKGCTIQPHHVKIVPLRDMKTLDSEETMFKQVQGRELVGMKR